MGMGTSLCSQPACIKEPAYMVAAVLKERRLQRALELCCSWHHDSHLKPWWVHETMRAAEYLSTRGCGAAWQATPTRAPGAVTSMKCWGLQPLDLFNPI